MFLIEEITLKLFLLVIKYTHNIKFAVLTILSVQFREFGK